MDDYSKDYVERDEKRLADLGRRAVEMFAISHIFTDLQVQTSLTLPAVAPCRDTQNLVTKRVFIPAYLTAMLQDRSCLDKHVHLR